MSNPWSITYDYAVAVTASDTVNDPAGPFAGLLCSSAGAVVVWPRNGPEAGMPLTINMVIGQTLSFPVRRVGSTGTSATVLGLVSAIVRQGY